MGQKNLDFRAVAFLAISKGVIRLGILGGVGGRWPLSHAHFVSDYISFPFLAASA
jgi:hypothetical protein